MFKKEAVKNFKISKSIYSFCFFSCIYMYEYTINMIIKEVNRVVESSIRFRSIKYHISYHDFELRKTVTPAGEPSESSWRIRGGSGGLPLKSIEYQFVSPSYPLLGSPRPQHKPNYRHIKNHIVIKTLCI